MLAWRKMLAVATREYLATVRTKTFLIALLLMPMVSVGAIVVPLLLEHGAVGPAKTCVVLDPTGRLLPELVRHNQIRERALADTAALSFSPPHNPKLEASPQPQLSRGFGGVRERFIIRSAGSSPSQPAELDRLRLELSKQTRQGELFAFIEVPATLFDMGTSEPLRYHSNTPTYLGLKQWLDKTVNQIVHIERLKQRGIDPNQVAQAQEIVALSEGALYELNDGRVQAAARPNRLAAIGVPLAAAMLMFMALLLAASPLMQSALEEKMHRIAEVLISSVPPLQLMAGKLLGAACVSYSLLGIYIVGALAVASQTGTANLLPPSMLLAVAGFHAIAMLMYGSIFLAVGAACSDLKQTQILMLPVMVMVTAPLFLLRVILVDPNGTAATAASLFPFFTPMLMMLRLTIPPGAPVWQVGLGAALSLLVAIGCLFAAARVFRAGLLFHGATPRLSDLIRWLRHG